MMCSAQEAPAALHVGQSFSHKECCHAKPCSALRPLAIPPLLPLPHPFPRSSPCLACQPHITRSPSLWRCKDPPAKMKRAEVKEPDGSRGFSRLVWMLEFTRVFLQFSSLQGLYFANTRLEVEIHSNIIHHKCNQDFRAWLLCWCRSQSYLDQSWGL